MAELAPVDQSSTFKLGFAGDTLNTAWYIAQISDDVDVSYLSAVGDDAISSQMRAFITASKINDTHIQTIPGETVGLYLIHLQNGERSFSYWRDNSAAKQLASDPGALSAAMAGVNLIYFSGITLAILDPASRKNLLEALKHARASGCRIAFDPNLRPRLWATPEEMTSTITLAAAHADIVLPSFDDEAAWFRDEDPVATLDRYAAVGAASIIVKNSDSPVLFQSKGNRGEVTVAPISDVTDTTAAGDSFNAAVLVGLLKGDDVVTTIKAGCQLAGQVVQQRGALVPNLCLQKAKI